MEPEAPWNSKASTAPTDGTYPSARKRPGSICVYVSFNEYPTVPVLPRARGAASNDSSP